MTDCSYPLTPLQQGMLFHTLSAPNSGVDVEQIICTLREPLDRDSFQRAWTTVARRHEVLRARFKWTGLDEPIQVVGRDAVFSWRFEDWMSTSKSERDKKLELFLERDRRLDFAMDRAPLMRHSIFRCGDEEHICVWTFHHALLDGRSWSLILKEVFSCYDAHMAGIEPKLELPISYEMFVRWLRQRPRGADKRFWRDELKGFRVPASIPFERGVVPADSTRVHAARQQRLSDDLTRKLQAVADSLSITINTLIQTAWALLISHYSGQRDVAFGVTRACRHGPLPGVRSIVGLLINTVPMRIEIGTHASTRELLQLVRRKHVALREAEHTSLVDIQRCSEIPAGVPLFDSLLVFDNLSLNDLLRSQGGAWKRRTFEHRGQTNYPLTLIAYGGEELRLRLEYDPRRFDGVTVDRIQGHLAQLLAEMVSNLDAPASSLRYISDGEARNLRPGSPAIADVRGTISERFEAQVARCPDRVALTHQGKALTYDQVNQRANRVAHRLRELGVREETLVGLFTQRNFDAVVGILAILKAGGGYVPLDPMYPRERLGFMLEDCKAPVLLTRTSLRDKLPNTQAQVVCLDEIEQGNGDGQLTENLGSCASAENLAYVIYTSGSTGRPKGVSVTHGNVLRLLDQTDYWFEFGDQDVWTLFHSYAFDFSVWELWGSLLYGGRLVVVPYELSRSPNDFYDLLIREGVTVLNQTPSAFKQLIHAEAATPSQALSLRYVILGGEALELASLKPWVERHTDAKPQLINMYGITETTVHVTYRRITHEDIEAGVGSVIGVPIPDVELYILDRYLHPVPIGVVGEMYVGGGGVSRGYLNRRELTQERFIESPFSDMPGQRLYRTGDLARFTPEGDIEYRGRVDQQVQIRGFRVELGEIQSVLEEHPAVRQALVDMREDHPGDQCLVAYYVVEDCGFEDASILREHLLTRLPDYMIPRHFVRIVEVPLTTNGKVDYRDLPRPRDFVYQRASHFLPRNDVERRVAAVWQELLGVSQVDIKATFFELGGHSLLMASMLNKLERAFGVKLPLAQLFRYPTIEALASMLAKYERNAGPSFIQTIEMAERQKKALKRQRSVASRRKQ